MKTNKKIVIAIGISCFIASVLCVFAGKVDIAIYLILVSIMYRLELL